MPDESVEIVRCPLDLRGSALAMVLSEIAPSQRREIAADLLDGDDPRRVADSGGEALYVALCRERLLGAAWGQRQPGNTAVFGPPRSLAAADWNVSYKLAEAVVHHLDGAGVGMIQVLLPAGEAELVPVLSTAGFSHLADLIYLSCEAELFPNQPMVHPDLEFVAYDPREYGRLIDIVERTYTGTLDCVGLNGQRRIEDVIEGYRETGKFRPENWLIAISPKLREDVGVLLLADHPRARHWELMYMGLAPEARGNGWGCAIARHAQWLARSARVERIVLAVDAVNLPALAMYERAGFGAWDRRRVFVRFCADPQA